MATAEKVRDKPGTLHRAATFKREAIDVDGRRVEVAFSSEAPYERFYGTEILDHAPGSVNLNRIADGTHPLLLNHNRDEQIGVVEKAWVDNDRMARAVVRFSKGALGEEIFQDVLDGIRGQVSVAYDVGDYESRDLGHGIEERRYTEWTPFEVSIVSIAADPSVGVGRGQNERKNMSDDEKEKQKREAEEAARRKREDEARDADQKTQFELTKKEVAQKELERTRDIMTAGREFSMEKEAEDAVEKQITSAEFNKIIMVKIKEKKKGERAMSRVSGDPDGNSSQILTPGEAFSRSDIYRAASKRQELFRSVNIEVPWFRATGTTTGLTSIQKLPEIVLLEQQPLTVESLFAAGTTESTTIRYIQEDTFTNAATEVAEEGQKPEASWDLSEVDDTIKKVAVIGRVTEEFFADYAMMQSYINNRLTYMVQAKVDTDLLNGAGGSAVTGLLQTAGIQTQAAAGTNNFDTLQHAITKVRSVGFYEPDGILLNPNDQRDLVLSKDGNQQYYGGGPVTGAYGQGGAPRFAIWGLPVVWTTAIAAGTAVVGAFRLGGQVWSKMGLRLDSTNSDASDFIYNRICLRAERRLTLSIYRPLAFVNVTF